MRLLTAALVLLCGVCTAAAEIRIDRSRYENGQLIVIGETEPDRTVTLDGKYTTESGPEGHFKFTVENYKPSTCMSDIQAGDDVYSAVIAGCFGATTEAGVVTPSAVHPKQN